jgi:TrpR-related protein YerC/YecD
MGRTGNENELRRYLFGEHGKPKRKYFRSASELAIRLSSLANGRYDKAKSNESFLSQIFNMGAAFPNDLRDEIARCLEHVSNAEIERFMAGLDVMIVRHNESFSAQITADEKAAVWSEAKSTTLLKAFLSLKNEKEAKDFFRDIMTENEICELDMRWRVANLLSEGLSVEQIEKNSGVSQRIIKRVQKWLEHGCGGYRLAIKRVNSKTGELARDSDSS